MKSLADRITLALKGPPKRSQAALARACKISPAAVSEWVLGKTVKIEAANLLAAARFLGVSPEWLASGKGPMCDESVNLRREPQSQPVKLDPGTMLSALRYLDRRFTEAGQRFDPFLDADLLCWAYEVESVTDAPPSNVIDFGREVAKRLTKGGLRDAKGGAG